MNHFSTPRRIVRAYILAGLLAGAVLGAIVSWRDIERGWATWLAPTPPPMIRLETRYDPKVDDDVWVAVEYPAPAGPSALQLAWPVFVDVVPFLLAGAAAGVFWGLAHLKVRESVASPFGDEEKLDYEEPTSRICPPGPT